MKIPFKPIDGIKWFCQTTLPAVYDDTLTEMQIMAKIRNGYNTMVRWFNELPAYLQKLINQLIIDTTGDTGKIVGAAWGYNDAGVAGETTQTFYLFKLPTGKTLMVDTGWNYENTHVFDFFEDMGIDKLDYIYITHFHDDHMGNFEYICDSNKIDVEEAKLFLPQTVDPAIAPDWYGNEVKVINCANRHSMDIIRPNVEGYSFDADADTTFSFYNVNHTPYYEAVPFVYNNCCLCMQLQYKNTSYFFSADVDALAQAHLATTAPKSSAADMAHHGTNTFIDKDYFFRISPDFLVAENGEGTASVSNNTNYLNRYSAENLLAQRFGKYVYPTSLGMSLSPYVNYVVPLVLDGRNVYFFTDALDTERVGKYNFAIGDATEQAATYNTNIYLEDFLSDAEGNSRNVFVVPNAYNLSPASTINHTGIADIIKTNSASSLQSLASTDATKDVYRAIAWYYLGVGYDTILASLYRDSSGTVSKDIQNMTGRNFIQVTTAADTSGSLVRYDLDNTAIRYFGDNAELSTDLAANGIKISKSGLYKISIDFIGSANGDGETPYLFRFGREADASNVDSRSEYGVAVSGVAPNGVPVFAYAENVVWLTGGTHTLFLDSVNSFSGSIRVRVELLAYSSNKTASELLG